MISGVLATGTEPADIASNDNTQIDKILKKLGSSVSARTFRTKTTDPKHSKLIVELNDANTRTDVFANAHSLRAAGAEFNGIFVNEDRTKLQRQIYFKLRQKCKQLNSDLIDQTTEGKHYDLFDNGANQGNKFVWAIRDSALKRVLYRGTIAQCGMYMVY